MMKPNLRLVKRVEGTEGKKFKKIPTLHKTTKATNYNVVRARVLPKKKPKILKAQVFLRVCNFGMTRRKTGEAQVTLMHELRENLLTQHKLGLSEKKVHRRAKSMEKKDYKWITQRKPKKRRRRRR